MAKAVLLLLALLPMVALTGCNDDEDETNVYFMKIDIDQSSVNFNNNTYLMAAMSTYITAQNDKWSGADSGQAVGLTEAEAKKQFEAFCNDALNKVNAMSLPVLDNTYCVILLQHSTSTPDAQYPTVATKKLEFPASSN